MKIRDLELEEESPQNKEHLTLAIPPLEKDILQPGPHPWIKPLAYLLSAIGVLIFIGLILEWLAPELGRSANKLGIELLQSPNFGIAIVVGFFAQVVDGALGMAYGITSTTFLLSTGVAPAAASAAVHVAEIFTTGFSGAAHLRFKNIDKRLFKRLLIPGIIGGVVGAYIITQLDAAIMKPIIATYLLGMGVYIISRAWKGVHHEKAEVKHVGKLALIGGFADSVGGGGWGPIVTSTLIAHGTNPRMTIGSVNSAEFFIAFSTAMSFVLLTELSNWQLIAGLVVGGMFAAPFAAWLCRHLSARTLLWIVGTLISFLSLFNLYKALF